MTNEKYQMKNDRSSFSQPENESTCNNERLRFASLAETIAQYK